MGSKGSTQVQAPDPLEIARTDATFNRINQFTPAGNLEFFSSGGGINNNAQLTFNPFIQQLFEGQLASDAGVLGMGLQRQEDIAGGSLPDLIQGLDTSGISGLTPRDFEQARGDVEQAFFDRTSSLLSPQFEQSEERLLQSLADRGIPRESEAGRTEIANFQRQRDDTFSRLADQSVLSGGQEQSRLFGLDQALTGFNNQLDIGTQLQDANLIQNNRATQFNELAALLGLQQVAQPGLGNFFSPSPTDVTGGFGLQNQANMANAQNASNQKGGVMGGLFDLGSAGIGLLGP
jgi:hypothetical protein